MTENPYQSPKEPGADEAFPRSEKPRARRRFVGLATFVLGTSMLAIGDAFSVMALSWPGGRWLGPVLTAIGGCLALWAVATSVGLARVRFTRKHQNRRTPVE